MTALGGKKTKAEMMLGLDRGVEASSAVRVELQGSIQMKESGGTYRKRFCVVKDGFFIWYSSAPSESERTRLPFDRKPKGVLPMNGALVRPTPDKNIIELIHNDISKASFVLKTDSPASTIEWSEKLKAAKKATWENAQLGAALLDRMKNEGTKLEQEKESAVKDLQSKILRLDKANKDKEQLLQKELKQNQEYQMKLEHHRATIEQSKSDALIIEKAMKEEDKVAKQTEMMRSQLESKLSMANLALRRLEDELSKYFETTHSTGRSVSSIDSGTSGNTARVQTAYQKALKSSSFGRHSKSKLFEQEPPTLPARKKLNDKAKSIQGSVLVLREFLDGVADRSTKLIDEQLERTMGRNKKPAAKDENDALRDLLFDDALDEFRDNSPTQNAEEDEDELSDF